MVWCETVQFGGGTRGVLLSIWFYTGSRTGACVLVSIYKQIDQKARVVRAHALLLYAAFVLGGTWTVQDPLVLRKRRCFCRDMSYVVRFAPPLTTLMSKSQPGNSCLCLFSSNSSRSGEEEKVQTGQ
jgi:hypothetical protein